MKTITEIARNLQIDENSDIALEFYKKQFIDKKYVLVKTGYITISERKEISSLVISDDFGMTTPKEIENNILKVNKILASAISLDEAYNNSINI